MEGAGYGWEALAFLAVVLVTGALVILSAWKAGDEEKGGLAMLADRTFVDGKLAMEVHHLELPSGRRARVRILPLYTPVQVEMCELTGIDVHDLQSLGEQLIGLYRAMRFPEGIISKENQSCESSLR